MSSTCAESETRASYIGPEWASLMELSSFPCGTFYSWNNLGTLWVCRLSMCGRQHRTSGLSAYICVCVCGGGVNLICKIPITCVEVHFWVPFGINRLHDLGAVTNSSLKERFSAHPVASKHLCTCRFYSHCSVRSSLPRSRTCHTLYSEYFSLAVVGKKWQSALWMIVCWGVYVDNSACFCQQGRSKNQILSFSVKDLPKN